ncbi:MAG: hypothetical protein AB1746_16375 [Candidatus Zixiibacteriota bacterium]
MTLFAIDARAEVINLRPGDQIRITLKTGSKINGKYDSIDNDFIKVNKRYQGVVMVPAVSIKDVHRGRRGDAKSVLSGCAFGFFVSAAVLAIVNSPKARTYYDSEADFPAKGLAIVLGSSAAGAILGSLFYKYDRLDKRDLWPDNDQRTSGHNTNQPFFGLTISISL